MFLILLYNTMKYSLTRLIDRLNWKKCVTLKWTNEVIFGYLFRNKILLFSLKWQGVLGFGVSCTFLYIFAFLLTISFPLIACNGIVSSRPRDRLIICILEGNVFILVPRCCIAALKIPFDFNYFICSRL